MKISYNWLKKYIDTHLDIKEVSDLLTFSGLEVEDITSYESLEGGLKQVVIGEVIEKEKHPDADKLSVTKVNVGNEILQIVCGAPNVEAGQKVVVALAGANLTFANGDKITIKKSKIRGVESNGMICAEDELGIGESHAGIMVLPPDTGVGTLAANYFNITCDDVLDINLTPNRGDAYNHLGVARDLNAVLMQRKGYSSTFTKPNFAAVEIPTTPSNFQVSIESNACTRYSGIAINNITVKKSPDWLINFLKSIGIKPVNNIVDITNFILFESGQPLHAFDADKITNKQIIVKHFSAPTPFITLDDQEVKLTEEDLVIADNEKPLCIAGVYGGRHSGITNTTKNIFIESACFNATSVRKTAARLNLRTEAAMHFEKGTDPNATINALKRAIELILEVAGGEVNGGWVDIYPTPIQPKQIKISYKNIDRLIGKKLDRNTIISILNSLEIETQDIDETGFTAIVPTFKTEVTREADIIEEILRIYGFDLVDIPTDVHASLSYRLPTDKQKIESKTAELLVSNGFYEIMTNPISQSTFYATNDPSLVKLQNSMTAALDSMRQTLLFGGLESIAYNLNRKNNKLRLFEFGAIYRVDENEKYTQQQQLVLFLAGWFQEKNWQTEAVKSSFFHLKSYTEKVLAAVGIHNCAVTESVENHAQYALALNYRNKKIASICAVNKKITKQFDIKEEVYFAVIDWEAVLHLKTTQKVKYKPVSKFPSIKRDLALVVNENIPYESIKTTAKKELKSQLLSLQLFDLYKGDKIAAEKKSMAITFTIGDEQKTLTDSEIEKMMSKLIGSLEKEHGAEIRK
jgi:phenylalanyl-tRNA synthetase beta chain